MTHRNLLVEVWGVEYEDDLQVLRAHVANLRRKIEPEGEHVFIRPTPASATASPPRAQAPFTNLYTEDAKFMRP